MKTIKEYIEESLISHDGNILLRKILDKFKDDILFYKTNNETKNNVVILLVIKGSFYDLYDNDEFNKLLDFFNYYISCVRFYTKSKGKGIAEEFELLCDWAKLKPEETKKLKNNSYVLCIEPKTAKNINDYVYNECSGIIYKVLNDKVEHIRDKGLRLSTREEEERDAYGFHIWSDRQYFLAGKTTEDIIESINYIKKERFGISDFNDAAVIRIDLKKHKLNLDFYQDVFLRDKKAIYTKSSNIPPEYIDFIGYVNDDNIKYKIRNVDDPLFEYKKERLIKGFDYNYTTTKVIEYVNDLVDDILNQNDINIKVIEYWVHGSRVFGNPRPDSDIDVVMYYKGNVKEDTIFNILHDEEYKYDCQIDDIDIDINPIRDQETGSLDSYIEKDKNYKK